MKTKVKEMEPKKYKNQIITKQQKGTTMKHNLFVLLGGLCLLVLLIPATMFATGTPVGTIIKNVASATYKDAGGTDMPGVKSDTAFTTVEQKAGLDLTPLSYNRIVGDSVNVYMMLTLTNTGNGTDNFPLSVTDQRSWAPEFFIDANQDGQPDNGTAVTNTGSLAADASYHFVLKIFVPNLTANATVDTALVTAMSAFDNSVKKYNHDTLTVNRVVPTTSKTASNSSPRPQDVVTYKVTFLNGGSSNAKGVTFIDALPSYVTYNNGTMGVDSGNGTPSFAAGTFTWDAGSVLPGRGIGFHFNATVNSGTPGGQEITNSASITYVDSISNRSKRDTSYITIVVADSLGWELKIDLPGGAFTANNKEDSVNVGTLESFVLKLTNHGNRSDTASIVKSTSLPLSWTIYADLNKNGAYDAGTDSVCTAFASTGSVPQNGSVWYVVKATPANTIADRSKDSSYYKFSSVSLSSNNVDGYTLTLVKAPLLQLIKTVTKVNGTSKPGDTLEYVVEYKNIGSGYATAVVVSDASPQYTSYVGETIYLRNSSTSGAYTHLTDAAADDQGTWDSSNVIVSLTGSIAGGKFLDASDLTWHGYIKFRVKVN
jgi:trimeric autotransporter adhesin